MVYTTFEICKKMGIRKERFREWIDRGYIKPSIQKASGRGTKNLFSKNDLYTIALFNYLIDRGFSREEVSRRISKIYQDWGGEDFTIGKDDILVFYFRDET